jgi:hypothetical protein
VGQACGRGCWSPYRRQQVNSAPLNEREPPAQAGGFRVGGLAVLLGHKECLQQQPAAPLCEPRRLCRSVLSVSHASKGEERSSTLRVRLALFGFKVPGLQEQER